MTPESDIKLHIINELSAGQFVSGQELADSMSVTRSAIAKHIKVIKELGLDIYSVKGKGYRLSEKLSLLDLETIKEGYIANNPIELHHVIDSTNAYLIRSLRENKNLINGHTVVAECQTDGRGRRGRAWVSPFGSHIYMSRYYQTSLGLSEASGLSLAIGIAVANSINRFVGNKAKLKWPNDVLVDNKKIAGVLIEAEGQSDGMCHLIIGIGINIQMPKDSSLKIDQPWTDINSNVDKPMDRNLFLTYLLSEIDIIMCTFRETRLDALYDTWNKMNAYKDKGVKVISGRNVREGTCLGIDSTGALLVNDNLTNTVFKAIGGEVSLRAANQ
ncbi:bifunctional biotin--[acetyl-CoA-carboxylase] ligase/biotin operon repressor BirA [Psychrosphaera haliotis]|uniref:bifunctional biotin--[acetyl-CoA-carboxylase] ligase/biotin operon repressor BirA n=1 Tax=Psychrosphaera haliotis TaxID=555083 RepID=UPI0031D1A507